MTNTCDLDWTIHLSAKPRPLDIVAKVPQTTTICSKNMADYAVAADDSLLGIPDNICISFLPNYKKLSERVLKRGLNYFLQGYIHQIKIYGKKVEAKCWRSMRKSAPPHRIRIEISASNITDSFCSCKAG